MKDHSEEEAKRICGALQRDLEGSITRDTPEQPNKAVAYEDNNGKLYLRVFLLDGSVNLNSWGVEPNSIRQNINTVIGKPLVMYKNSKGEFDHPSLAEHDYQHALAYQDLYRVGTFIDVVESQQNPGRWFGISEVTDENVRKAIREDPTIPFYDSPTIRLLHPYQSDQAIRDWEMMHVAIVSEPAYGTSKAFIGGQCSGDQNTCLLQLRKASIQKNAGKVGCGFCTYEATKEIQEKVSQNISSLETNGLQLQNRNKVMANSDNNSNSSEVNTNNNNNQQPNNQVTQQVEQQKETTKVTKQQNKPVAGSGNEGNNKEEEQQKQKGEQEGEGTQKEASTQELFDRNERLSRKNKELELQLQQARADVEGYKTLNAQFNDRLASLEKERDEERRIARVNDITSYVKSAAAFKLLSPAEKEKQIETYVNSSMPLDVIKSQTELLNASFQKASMGAFASASYTPRLQLGGNNSKSVVETRSASTSNSDNNDRLPASLRLHKMYGSSDGGIQ